MNKYSIKLMNILEKNKFTLFDDFISVYKLMNLAGDLVVDQALRNADKLVDALKLFYESENAVKIHNWIQELFSTSNILSFKIEELLQIIDILNHDIRILIEKDILDLEERYYISIMLTEGISEIRNQLINIYHNTSIEETKKNEEKYRTLLESLPQKIFLKNNNLEYISCNKNYALDLGIKSEEVISKNDYDFFPKELADKYRQDDRRIIESGKTETIIEKYLKEGKETVVETVKVPLYNKDGDSNGVIGIFWDITAKIEVENSLKESEKRLHDIAFSSADWIWELNEKGEYTYTSGKVLEILGYEPEELLGKKRLDLILEEEAVMIQPIFDEIVSNRENMIDLITWNLAKNGKEVCLLTNGVPILDDKGNLLGYRGVDKDITQIVRMTEELTRSEVLYKSVFESYGTAHAIIFKNDKPGLFNDCFVDLLGYSKSELEDLEWKDVFPIDEFQKFSEYSQKRIIDSSDIPNQYESKMIAKNGEIKQIIISATIIPGTEDKFVSIKDITDLRRTEREVEVVREDLVRQEKLALIGKLSSSINHDLRTPLATIVGALDFLQECLKTDDPMSQKIFNLIKKSVERSMMIMDQFNDMTRLKIPNLIEVDVNDFLTRIITEYMISSTIELKFEYSKNEITSLIDPNQLTQVLDNLISNAVHAMGGEGILTIQTESDEKNIFLVIKDNGIGISEDDQKNIFKPLFTTKPDGVGLGLSIVKDIIENHSGSIEVNSKLGDGTEFILTLPRIRTHLVSESELKVEQVKGSIQL